MTDLKDEEEKGDKKTTSFIEELPPKEDSKPASLIESVTVSEESPQKTEQWTVPRQKEDEVKKSQYFIKIAPDGRIHFIPIFQKPHFIRLFWGKAPDNLNLSCYEVILAKVLQANPTDEIPDGASKYVIPKEHDGLIDTLTPQGERNYYGIVAIDASGTRAPLLVQELFYPYVNLASPGFLNENGPTILERAALESASKIRDYMGRTMGNKDYLLRSFREVEAIYPDYPELKALKEEISKR